MRVRGISILVLASWSAAWGIGVDGGIGEFSHVFDNSVLVESQGLYGFSGWLVDPAFASSMGGPVYRFGRVLEFRMGPFGTVRPTLLPVNPIALDSFAVAHDYQGSSASTWILKRDSHPASFGTIRYRFGVGGDTGDPLIHRYTQPEWSQYNRDKIGPTHALYLGRRFPLTNGGVMDVSLAGGERRYNTLTPENQESRRMLSADHAYDWNQQRWVSGVMTYPQGCLEAGFCDFNGWEYFPILGFELPVEGWTTGAGAEVEFPYTDRLKSVGTASWSAFGVEYPVLKGVPYGNHSHSDFRLRHRLHYRTNGRLTWIFDQELESRNFQAHTGHLILPGSQVQIIVDDTDTTRSVEIFGLSAVYNDDRFTLTGTPVLRIEHTVRYINGLDEFEGGITAERRTESGKSLFGVQLWTFLRLVDPMEDAIWFIGRRDNLEFFSIGGGYEADNKRTYIGQCYFHTNMSGWLYSINYAVSIIPNKYRPQFWITTFMPEGVSIYHRYYYPKGRQDDMTVTCQIRKEPTKIFGGRAEYRFYRSWHGIHAGIPEHRGIIELQARIKTGLKASLMWQGYSSSDWSDMVAGDDTELPAWGVWALSLSQTTFRGKLEGTIRMWNLTDQLIRTHPLGPMRPRRLELAIQLVIG